MELCSQSFTMDNKHLAFLNKTSLKCCDFLASVRRALQKEVTEKRFTDSQIITLSKVVHLHRSCFGIHYTFLICHNRKNHRCH